MWWPEDDVKHTWAAFALPYLEESNIFDVINLDRPVWSNLLTGGDPPWVSYQFPFYLCPSDIGPNQHLPASSRFAHGNYSGNFGTKSWFQIHPSKYGRTVSGLERAMLEHSPMITRGVFEKTLNGENDGIPFRRITDGTSKTVLLGEVRQFAGNDGRGVFYLGSGSFYSHEFPPNSNALDSSEWCTAETKPEAPCTTQYSGSRGPFQQTARSQHPGGVHMAYCDGHIEFTNDSIDMRLYRAIATRAGGDDESTPLDTGAPPPPPR
jgi:prepilin-type processing-associated H-X9-DG protein